MTVFTNWSALASDRLNGMLVIESISWEARAMEGKRYAEGGGGRWRKREKEQFQTHLYWRKRKRESEKQRGRAVVQENLVGGER